MKTRQLTGGNERIVVVGSINMDLVVSTPRLPVTGETILAHEFRSVPGGKGANQAYCAAKLGAKTMMIGCVGTDVYGDRSLDNLASVGVDTRYVRRSDAASSGIAIIVVDDQANNSIMVVPGTNSLLTPDDLDRVESSMIGAGILMLQLEVPINTVERAIEIAQKHGIRVILDPGPARQLSDEMLTRVDFITPNQAEAEMLTGIQVVDLSSARSAGRILRSRGVKSALVKLGADGVLVIDENGEYYVPGHRVQAVDTTAAGDSFAASLAVALNGGMDNRAAIKYANVVAALSVTRFGAQSSMPTSEEVDQAFITMTAASVLA